MKCCAFRCYSHCVGNGFDVIVHNKLKNIFGQTSYKKQVVKILHFNDSFGLIKIMDVRQFVHLVKQWLIG
jgi:hypothetical protein